MLECTSYVLENYREISDLMSKLCEDKVGISLGVRANTCIIENDHTREALIIQNEFGALHKAITKLPSADLKVETNMQSILDSLYSLLEIIGKTKQLIANLCDLLGHQKVLFTSAELKKYLGQIRDNRKLALPFFISNFGSILLGQMVQVHIVFINNELFVEMVIPFTDRDLFLLYEMQTFPVFQTNLQDKTLAAYIQSRAESIAVADSSNRYLFLNQTDLKKCNERNTFFVKMNFISRML